MLLNILEKEQYIIVDNLFTKKDQRVIKDNLFDPFFPWYLTEHRNKKQKFSSLPKISKQKNVEEYVKFIHLFSEGDKNLSKYSEIITSMIKVILQKFKLNELQIIRAKANLQTSNTKTKKNKLWKKVIPKQGRVLIFNGNIKHAAGCPVDNQVRAVININVKK